MEKQIDRGIYIGVWTSSLLVIYTLWGGFNIKSFYGFGGVLTFLVCVGCYGLVKSIFEKLIKSQENK